MISKKHKLIYIPVYKNGSTSMFDFLKKNHFTRFSYKGCVHPNVEQIYKRFENIDINFDDYTFFTSVIDQNKAVKSFYKYRFQDSKTFEEYFNDLEKDNVLDLSRWLYKDSELKADFIVDLSDENSINAFKDIYNLEGSIDVLNQTPDIEFDFPEEKIDKLMDANKILVNKIKLPRI